MPKKTKEELLGLISTLSDADRADFASLFSDIEERETRIKDLTKSKEDADKIAARGSTLQKERDELAQQKTALELKLAGLTGTTSDEIELTAFAPFFNLFG